MVVILDGSKAVRLSDVVCAYERDGYLVFLLRGGHRTSARGRTLRDYVRWCQEAGVKVLTPENERLCTFRAKGAA